MKKFKTHYDNLQVAESASPEVIRGAYRSLAQRWHPDKNPEQREEAERITRLINAAYAVLSDPQRRREHDAWIKAQLRIEVIQTAPPQSWPGPRPVPHNPYEYNLSSRRTGHFIPAWLILLFIAFVVILVVVMPHIARYLLIVLVWLAAGGYAYSKLFNPEFFAEEERHEYVRVQEANLRRKAAGVGWLMGFISWPLSVAVLMLVGLPLLGAGIKSLIVACVVGLISWTITVVSQRT